MHRVELEWRLAAAALAVVFLMIALVSDWFLATSLVAAVLLPGAGYLLAKVDSQLEDEVIEDERQALVAELRKLDQTRRVRSVLLDARRAMQSEARRNWTPPTSSEHGRDNRT